jgi:hypothetical protein
MGCDSWHLSDVGNTEDFLDYNARIANVTQPLLRIFFAGIGAAVRGRVRERN